ncbi:hypothetical protein GCM10010151_58890 [Actinoallomurus spadix]|uniref:Uncharacterized protein n=1 Tax=Actinoallomurus spadix TaxID=79912 RepID=A0ABP3H3A4_9ACTN
MIESSRLSDGWGGGVAAFVAQQGPQDVDQAAGQSHQGLLVFAAFGSFALVVGPAGATGFEAGQGGEVEHPAQDFADDRRFVNELVNKDFDPAICPWTGTACPDL